mmetsp:Transcript_110289/g.235564  ORF Transcript_110289/g.235564 Transcript_110289/m.235564 type:complete len:202 (-) Transcript_110289:72-677(-)
MNAGAPRADIGEGEQKHATRPCDIGKALPEQGVLAQVAGASLRLGQRPLDIREGAHPNLARGTEVHAAPALLQNAPRRRHWQGQFVQLELRAIPAHVEALQDLDRGQEESGEQVFRALQGPELERIPRTDMEDQEASEHQDRHGTHDGSSHNAVCEDAHNGDGKPRGHDATPEAVPRDEGLQGDVCGRHGSLANWQDGFLI